jgi:phage shock protein C
MRGMEPKRLYRDREHAMLGGVCAGIANRFALDPTLVRVAVIGLGVVYGGVALLVYLALWIVIPAGEAAPARPSKDAITEEFREAGERIQEAAQIAARAAREAVDEISQIPARRSEASTPEAASPAPEAAAPAPEGEPSPASPVPPASPTSPVPPATPPAPSATDEARRQQEQQQQ